MKFSESHEWVDANGREATIGVSNHAQQELGDIVYVELPEVGRVVVAGEEIVVLESTKAAADVYSFVSGKIIAINDALVNTPELVNDSPEQDGWLVKVEMSDPKEMDSLMSLEDYQASLA